jgi:HEAT repeat protein
MSSSKMMKCGALFFLSLGLVLLAGYDDLLAAGKADEAKKHLETLKTSKVAKERAEAAVELGKIGEVNFKHAEPAIETLTEALDDKEATVRAAAAVALGKIGPDDKKALVTKLRGMLKDDKEESVQLAATQALGFLGKDATEAVSDLRAVKKDLADPKGKFSKAIDAAIRTIQPPKPKKS